MNCCTPLVVAFISFNLMACCCGCSGEKQEANQNVIAEEPLAQVAKIDQQPNPPALAPPAPIDPQPKQIAKPFDPPFKPEKKEPEPKPINESDKFLFSRKVRAGDFNIFLVQSFYGVVPLFDGIRKQPKKSSEELITILVSVHNVSETTLRYYDPWKMRDFSAGRDFATLRDEFGNQYPQITFGLGVTVDHQISKRTRIGPGDRIFDYLVFDPPIAKAKQFTLFLPQKNLGQTGPDIAFNMPRWFLLGQQDPAGW